MGTDGDDEREREDDREHGGHVLLVEDEGPAVRLFELATTELSGDIEVTVARTGQQALDHLTGDDPTVFDLVVLDLDLPDTSGFEVLRRLRARPDDATAPVVILSHRDDRESVEEGDRLGANAHFVKTGDYQSLLGIVQYIATRWLGEDEEVFE